MRWFAMLVVALALVAAGCGGGSDSSTAADETTTEETTTSSESTTTEETTESGATDTDTSGTTVLTEDCLAAVSAFSAIAAGTGAAGGGNDAGVDEAVQSFEAYADQAPEEIQNDIRVLAGAYSTYIKALQDLGLKAGDTPSADQLAQLASASGELNTPEVTAAGEHFNEWASTNCPR